MSAYRSGFADDVTAFVDYRKKSGAWNETVFGKNISLFDRFCADFYPNEKLSQVMVDSWCSQRSTELCKTCYARGLVVRAFVNYLRERGKTNVIPPALPKQEKERRMPHAFSFDELQRFFHECDRIPLCCGISAHAAKMRKITCPVFFRLLYSSGIRTTEARFLKRSNIDLISGVLDIQKSKGHDQHYVALHESMTVLLKRYDEAADSLQPERTYFFESPTGECYSRAWVSYNFSVLWEKANGRTGRTVPYDLRHNYAIENINGWNCDAYEFNDRLHYLARSMGHRTMESTLYYYSLVPGLADTIREKTEDGFNSIVPEAEAAYEE